MKAVISVLIACVFAVTAAPALAADSGYPEGQGWQEVERDFDELDSALATVEAKIDPLDGKLDALQSTADDILDAIGAVEEKLDNQAAVITVEGILTTQASTQTAFNLDFNVGLPFQKIKRYTVVFLAPIALLDPAGVAAGNKIEVRTGVLQSNPLQTTDVIVFRGNSPGSTSAAVGPYAGSNSYVSVVRGADGQGPLDVKINAFIEVLP